jgi:hypothetical protein
MNRLSFIVVASAALAACSSELDVETSNPPPSGGTSGAEDNTFDHENDGISPWELVDRLIKEGPPRFTSHMHSCAKVKYETLGQVLRSVGVNTASTTALSAGDLYRSGANAMGAANYANRIRENVGITTSGASRMFDIFAAAAPEVIEAMPNLERCKVNDTPAVLFNDANQCEPSGIACLIGAPPQAAHLDLCNQTIINASSIDVGKRMAVAVMLAAAYSCE